MLGLYLQSLASKRQFRSRRRYKIPLTGAIGPLVLDQPSARAWYQKANGAKVRDDPERLLSISSHDGLWLVYDRVHWVAPVAAPG